VAIAVSLDVRGFGGAGGQTRLARHISGNAPAKDDNGRQCAGPAA
jgi:hypothetical protein